MATRDPRHRLSRAERSVARLVAALCGELPMSRTNPSQSDSDPDPHTDHTAWTPTRLPILVVGKALTEDYIIYDPAPGAHPNAWIHTPKEHAVDLPYE